MTSANDNPLARAAAAKAAAEGETVAAVPAPTATPPKGRPGPKPKERPEPVLNEAGAVVHSTPTVLKGEEATPDFGTPEYAAYIARIRDTRKPFGDFVQKLARKSRVGYYRVWINDEPGRIQQAKNAGYVHVKDEATGKIEVFNVNPHTPVATQLAYLMEIPQEIWELDQILKHRRADQIEAAIRKSKVIAPTAGDAKEDEGGFYVPGGGSKVDTIGQGRT